MALAMTMLTVFVPSSVFHAVIVSVTLAMTCLILRHVNIIIPSVFYEIDRSATRIIFAAVLAPVLLMTGGHMQVDRLINNANRCRSNHDWLCVDDLWLRIVSNVNATIKAGLTDTNRYANIGGVCCCSNEDDQDSE